MMLGFIYVMAMLLVLAWWYGTRLLHLASLCSRVIGEGGMLADRRKSPSPSGFNICLCALADVGMAAPRLTDTASAMRRQSQKEQVPIQTQMMQCWPHRQ